MSSSSEDESLESDLLSENSLGLSGRGVFGRFGEGLDDGLVVLSLSGLREDFSSGRLSLR